MIVVTSPARQSTALGCIRLIALAVSLSKGFDEAAAAKIVEELSPAHLP